jgi:DNA repair protein RadA/Sms
VSGFDLRRLQLLLAVLEKRGGFHFGVKDVF